MDPQSSGHSQNVSETIPMHESEKTRENTTPFCCLGENYDLYPPGPLILIYFFQDVFLVTVTGGDALGSSNGLSADARDACGFSLRAQPTAPGSMFAN